MLILILLLALASLTLAFAHYRQPATARIGAGGVRAGPGFQPFSGLRLKWVMRLDEIQRHFRFLRLMWERGTPGDGTGYSVKLAVGAWPRLFEVRREAITDLRVSILGLRVHYCRSYGGRFG